MIRVLHLASEAGNGADVSARQMRSALTDRLAGEWRVTAALIGRGGNYRNRFDAVMKLRRRNFDLIHAWDAPALAAAAIGSHQPILYSPSGLPTRRQTRWLAAAMRYRPIHAVLPGQTQVQSLLGRGNRGVPAERCRAIRPGVDFSRVRGRRDAELRRRLGLADGDYAILAPGQTDRQFGHLLSIWAASILHVYDPSWKLVLWGHGRQLARARKLAHQLQQPRLLRTASELLGTDVPFDALPAACDAAVIAADESAPIWPTAVCMAAALPIVSVTTYAQAELLEDHHTALLVPRPSAHLLAQRLLSLREDPALGRKLGDRARAEAFDYCALTRFVQEYRAMYEEMVSPKSSQRLVTSSPGAPGED